MRQCFALLILLTPSVLCSKEISLTIDPPEKNYVIIVFMEQVEGEEAKQVSVPFTTLKEPGSHLSVKLLASEKEGRLVTTCISNEIKKDMTYEYKTILDEIKIDTKDTVQTGHLVQTSLENGEVLVHKFSLLKHLKKTCSYNIYVSKNKTLLKKYLKVKDGPGLYMEVIK